MLRIPVRLRMTFLAVALLPVFTNCDTAPIEYNEYIVESITTPIDAVVQQKKVYIGHSLPVNVTVTATYDEEDIPLQFYLLNVDDVHYVEKGIGDAGDVRVYYCYQTEQTRIKSLKAGTHSYGVVINIPAEQSRDALTGDFKIGTYYVVAEVDANDQAEIDAYKVFRKFRGKLDDENTIFVASEYMKKPDLSVEPAMNFTGTKEAPQDSVTFYELDMSKLPGAQAVGLPSFFIKPSQADRTFEGTVVVKSSSADTLNVPVKFFLEPEDASFSVPLKIYDNHLEGFVDEYFIPILRKNTSESVTLQLQIGNDIDAAFFSAYDTDDWPDAETRWNALTIEEKQDQYPLFLLFYEMTKMGLPEGDFVQEQISVNHITTNESPSKDYTFKLKAFVNPDGKITESRFIDPNDDNSEYTEESYLEDGDVYDTDNRDPLITLKNNYRTEDVILRLEKIFVEPNEGAKFYPCSKIDANDDQVVNDADCLPEHEYRQMILFWGGWGAHIGNNNLGAGFDIWTGLFFRNFSLFSVGVNLYAHVSDFVPGRNIIDVQGGWRLSLTGESHPFDTDKSYYEFVVLGNAAPMPGVNVEWGDESDWWAGNFNFFSFKDEAQGFGDYAVNAPVTFDKFKVSFDIEVVGVGIEISLRGGFGGIYIVPRIDAHLYRDGSLRFEIAADIGLGIEAEASLGAFDLIGVGVEGAIEIVAIDLGFGAFTRVYYNEFHAPGQAKGSIGFGPDIWLTGPQGHVKVFVDLPLLLASVRIEQTILSFQAFKVKLYDEPFVESDRTGWVDLAKPSLVDYSYGDLRTVDDLH